MTSTILRKTRKVWEFGDFQTPNDLAHFVTQIVVDRNIKPKSIIEPSCGRGAFLISAIKSFPEIKKAIGVDINKDHLDRMYGILYEEGIKLPVDIVHNDFFSLSWEDILRDLPEPILIVGNPPWVTSAELGMLGSSNLPQKSTFQGRNGFEAKTGKSNFDISEWMLIKHLEWLKDRNGMIAMLCKESVARKVLNYAWRNRYQVSEASIYKFDAMKYFNAAVDACLFLIAMNNGINSNHCNFYEKITDKRVSNIIGYDDGVIVANVSSYNKLKSLRGIDNNYKWRSGVKHDCAKIMELERDGEYLRNGKGVIASLEDTYVYPMLKSSDIGNGRILKYRKYMLVTQKFIGEDTGHIEINAPKTWRYLNDNVEAFTKRASSIYRNRPQFSIFGVGDYTFSPWKVAISGFYKNLSFKPIGLFGGRPTIFDDTIYFLACWSEDEAKFIAEILNSGIAQEFLGSMIFWSDKRPITIELLKRLNIHALACELGKEKEYIFYTSSHLLQLSTEGKQPDLLIA